MKRFRFLTRPGILLATAAIWLTAVLTGTAMLLSYSNTPGASRPSPSHWPAESQLPFRQGKFNLILFAHPRCPCTRATLGELEQLVADSNGQYETQVWFTEPEGVRNDWVVSDLWRTAAVIPGVTVHVDRNGAEARRFGAETSGQTLLYDGAGELLFQGGITIARGHAGDNPGRSVLEKLARAESSTQKQTPVFGCPLFGATRPPKGNSCTP